jgi:hypothetical protein
MIASLQSGIGEPRSRFERARGPTVKVYPTVGRLSAPTTVTD